MTDKKLPRIRLNAKQRRPEDLNWYVYRDRETDDLVEIGMTMTEMMENEFHGLLECQGRDYKRDVVAEYQRDNGQVPQKTRVKTRARWPMTTSLWGVDSTQVGQLRRELEKNKITGVDVLKDGNMVISDKKAYRQVARMMGLYSRNAGYSDPAPLNK